MMKNVECIICGNEIIIQLHKQIENRKYCSEKCKNTPSIFHKSDDLFKNHIFIVCIYTIDFVFYYTKG